MKKILLIVSTYLLLCCCNFATEWKPIAGGLMTRWADQVDPSCPLPEYPTPQMVRSEWLNLNGLWDYAISDNTAQQSAINDGKILVPFAIESALSGVKKALAPSEKLWYKRTFDLPKSWGSKQIILHFGAVDYDATVKVNGKLAGRHIGSSDAFSFNITDLLVSGQKQQITLEVLDPTDKGEQPRGKQVLSPRGIFYTAVSGIWKTVWIEPVSTVHLKNFVSTPDIDENTFSIKANVTGANTNTKVRYTAFDGKSQIAQVTVPASEQAIMKINGTKLWSPDSPFLYDLKIEVLQNGKVTDNVDSYFGMRKISIGKDAKGVERIMLNNKFLFQYGFLDQGWWPDGLLTAPTEEALKFDIDFTKNAGYNTIRKHIKVESDRFYYLCDKMGMIVWQDAVSGDSFNLKNMPKGRVKSELSAKQFKTEFKATIDQLRNYPCIVNWVVFNEGWGQYGDKTLIDWTKRYDPTRLAEVSGWVDMGNGDICDIHRYPAPGRLENPGINRAFAVGEFGGYGLPVKGHLWNPEMNNWGYATYTDPAEFTKAYKHAVFHLRTMINDGLSAAIYTQTTDVEGEVNGMLTYDREVEKIPVKELAALHKQLYNSPVDLKVVMPNSEKVAQEWSYTFEQPAQDWYAPSFSSSAWSQGEGMFGYNHSEWQLGYTFDERTDPAHLPRTEWKSENIWLRREFTLDQIPAKPYLKARYDEHIEVYINGELVANINNRLAHYSHSDLIEIPISASKLFKRGRNTIAVYCKRNIKPNGPANLSLDMGIVDAGR